MNDTEEKLAKTVHVEEQMEEQIQKKKKRQKHTSPASKIIKRILIAIGAILLFLIVGISPFIASFIYHVYYFPSKTVKESYERIDISLSEEQRLKDLEALYENACLMNPVWEDKQELYGMDYETLYKEYQEIVVNAEDEFSYYCALYNFVSYFGSGHTHMLFPRASEMYSEGFQLNARAVNRKNMDRFAYTWEQTIREQIQDYTAKNGTLKYVAGNYVLHGYSDECIWPTEYRGLVVTAIDGISPDEFVKTHEFLYPLEYDDILQKTYRANVRFNVEYGIPVNLTIELEDGSTVDYPVYYDARCEVANYLDKYYSRYESNTDVFEVSDNYMIYENDEADFIYFKLDSCLFSADDEKMVEELKAALTRHDTLILDLRTNGGGSEGYCGTYIYPYIFEDNLVTRVNYEISLNDVTKQWVRDVMNLVIYSATIDRERNVITYEETYTYYGQATKTTQVYVLVSEDTFSAADTFVSDIKDFDNVTIIGSHTGGEGTEGMIFMYSLPESYLLYGYTPCYNVETKGEDILFGVTPDIVMTESLECYQTQRQYWEEGIDTDSYEVMMEYDNVLQDVVEMLSEK